MGSRTKIEWCDATWNPVTGCLHGCEYCYARRMANRFTFGTYGKGDPDDHDLVFLTEPETREITDKNGKKKSVVIPYPFGFEPTFHNYRLDIPQRWPKHKVIFVCSMADLFGEWVDDAYIEAVFEACRKAPQHTYLFLTKNPDRLCDLANNKKLPTDKNFWYGSTLDSKNARRYPGRFRDHTFLSIEPLQEYMDVGLGSFGSAEWIIIGAETGNRKEKIIPEKAWIDNICEAASITQAAVFMKDSLIPIVGEENMRREFPWDMPRYRE